MREKLAKKRDVSTATSCRQCIVHDTYVLMLFMAVLLRRFTSIVSVFISYNVTLEGKSLICQVSFCIQVCRIVKTFFLSTPFSVGFLLSSTFLLKCHSRFTQVYIISLSFDSLNRQSPKNWKTPLPNGVGNPFRPRMESMLDDLENQLGVYGI